MDMSRAMVESWHAYSCNLGELYERERDMDMSRAMVESWHAYSCNLGELYERERHGHEHGRVMAHVQL